MLASFRAKGDRVLAVSTTAAEKKRTLYVVTEQQWLSSSGTRQVAPRQLQ